MPPCRFLTLANTGNPYVEFNEHLPASSRYLCRKARASGSGTKRESVIWTRWQVLQYAGLAIAILELVEAISNQAGTLIHTSNLYHIAKQEQLGSRLAHTVRHG